MVEYIVSKADLPRERGNIINFLKSHFFKSLNVLEMFGLQEEPPPELPDNASFVVKAEDLSGRLVGVAYSTTQPTDIWAKDKSERERELVEFFEHFEEQAGLHELEGSVELWLLCVREDWGRRGVARRLAAESERLARDAGYRMITMTCLNEYTARLAAGLGWRETWKIRYQDYPRLSGRQVDVKPTPPHDTLYLYVKEL